MLATALSTPFPTTDESRFQNSYEFLAVVLGLLLARRLGLRSFAYDLYGDNTSSLHWAASDRAASSLARRANIAFTLLATDIDAVVADTVHVPGVDNVTFDRLSRGATAAEVGLPPERFLTIPTSHPIAQFVTLCDPLLPIDTATAHFQLSNMLLCLLSDPSFYS